MKIKSLRCLVRSVTALVFLLSASSVLQAAPWAVVADSPKSCISILDFGTTPVTVYGTFVTNQLGSEGGGIFDVAITPDGKNALISNFGDSAVRRVDISNPTNPVVTGLISNGFFAEDIAIAPNGQFALVTDGGFSPVMGIIDLSNFTTSLTYSVTSGYANAVAIAPDNQTVVLADYSFGRIICGTMGPTGLVSETVLYCASPSGGTNRPVNVSISPDGKTVLTANANSNEVNVFQIISPGVVVTGSTPTVRGLVGGLIGNMGMQSIAFSPCGDRAYVLQNGVSLETNAVNMLSWLQINGPGNVTLGGVGVATLLAQGSSQLFGVDTLAVSPDGAWILAGNPTLSGSTNAMSVVNASTFAVTRLDPLQEIPVGVAFVPTSTLTADLDGDRMDDFITVVGSRWYIWFSSQYYMVRSGPYDLGYAGLPAAGDVDGDGLPDLVSVVGSNWYVWFSSLGYQTVLGPFDLGICGRPALGDVDGDGIADLLMTVGPNWYAWFSTSGFQFRGGPYDLGIAGLPTTGDIDRDGKDDLIMTVGSKWYVWFSGAGYQVRSGPFDLGITGTPAVGDMDGDGAQDLIDVAGNNWYVWSSRSQYQARISYNPLNAP